MNKYNFATTLAIIAATFAAMLVASQLRGGALRASLRRNAIVGLFIGSLVSFMFFVARLAR